MRDGSQPGDLAYARGRLYVAEEFGTPPAIAIVDPDTGVVEKRIELAPGSRPHHVHRSPRGDLVAFGLYGTDKVAVVDTTTESLLGPWDTDPGSTSGRDHAARLLEGREDPLRRERRDEPGDRARATDGRGALADGRARGA